MKRYNILTFSIFVILILLASTASGTLVKVTPEQMTEQAQTIVVGHVDETYTFVNPGSRAIETGVVVTVSHRIKGESPATFTIIIPGGIILNSFMFKTDFPHFEQGREVVLFLKDDCSKLVGQIQGKYTIQNGMIKELSIDSTDFIDSIRNMTIGLAPVVNLDRAFFPETVEMGIIKMLDSKFGYDGLKWDTKSINLYINENSSDTTGEGAAVKTSMQTWNNAPANFSFNYKGTHSRTHGEDQNWKNEVLWSSMTVDAIAYAACWGDGYGYLIECDLVFNTDYTWSAQGNPASQEMDVQNIATHELGHFLQLLDLYNNWDYEKTMYGYADTGETYKRTLHNDDKNGIAHIYGTGPGDDDDDTTDDDDDTVPDDDDDQDDDDQDDDDDSGDDDDDDFSGSDCYDFMELLYDDCDMKIYSSGDPLSGSLAYDMCKEGDGPWECMFDCMNHDKVDSCSSFVSCLTSKCDLSFPSAGSSDDDDDDSGGGLCG